MQHVVCALWRSDLHRPATQMDKQNASSVASSSSVPLSSGSRHTRIHFTDGADLFVEPSVKTTRTTKPVRRQTPLAALPVDSPPRRRIHSIVDGPSGSMPYSRPRKTFSTISHQRSIHIADNDSGFDSGPSTLNAFSDEYDLCECIIREVAECLTFR